MKKNVSRAAILVIAGLALALFLMAPADLLNQAAVPEIGADPTAWLAERESRANAIEALIPGTEKQIRWFGGVENRKTRYSIVYLHGFSATRQEIAPVGAMVSDALGANLFETRLAGHGLQQHALADVRAEDWLDDAAEALAIGAAIGDRVIVMGTSTGATLALAMAGHPAFAPVSMIVLLSPNFAPKDANADYLTWPGGPELAYLTVGRTRSWVAQNELQARYWTTTYPMAAVIEMMRLVKFVRGRLPLQLDQAVLLLYSPDDRVVDTDWVLKGYELLDSPRKQLIEIPGSADQSNHILAGDIMAPENNRRVADAIVEFVTAGR